MTPSRQRIDPGATARASVEARDMAGLAEGCAQRPRPAPCAVVVFGASGDLAARKVFPALFRLMQAGLLPEQTAFIGASRTAMDDQAFRERMRRAMQGDGNDDPAAFEAMAARLSYQTLDYESPDDYAALGEALKRADRDLGTAGNRLYYLAVPPHVSPTIGTMLGRAGLARESGGTFARLVAEKPFGSDLSTALELDRTLHEHFAEHQIFRIDHYLAKEAVQNILMFRFANAVFEPVWNRDYVADVTVAACESLGVEHRAGYYERAGVLRDMFQNHMMQLLALSAIEPPPRFEADMVRDEKVKLYSALRPFEPSLIDEHLVLGQYGPGRVDDSDVPGYRDEPGVDPASVTPTFAALTAFVDNWRWQGVPFRLVSGKRLARKLTRIVVRFKEVPHALFRTALGGQTQAATANRLLLDIHPEESITLTFQAKRPGERLCLRPVTMHFDFRAGATGPRLPSYATVLHDVMLGDHTLFWRGDGVARTWGFLTPVLDSCDACGDREHMLHPYAAGSWGPEPARHILEALA